MISRTSQDIDRLVEQITRQVMLVLSAEAAQADGSGCTCQDGQCVRNCVERVQHVVQAGASRISAGLGSIPADQAVASFIDHTLLKPEATEAQVAQLCYEARKHHFAAVCVNPTYVALCRQLLAGSPVKIATVVGFPLGATSTEVKAYETQRAITEGADEIDMVVNIGALKSKDFDLVYRDIASVVHTAHAGGAIVKVIIEAALLTDEEKIVACQLSKDAGADFVKTSTGFGPGGATAEDVALMRRVVGPTIGVKAAGGIKSYADAQKMVAAGATRIGASAGVKIMKEATG